MFFFFKPFCDITLSLLYLDASTDRTLYDELRDLVHDKDIVCRIESLVSSLRGSYNVIIFYFKFFIIILI